MNESRSLYLDGSCAAQDEFLQTSRFLSLPQTARLPSAACVKDVRVRTLSVPFGMCSLECQPPGVRARGVP